MIARDWLPGISGSFCGSDRRDAERGGPYLTPTVSTPGSHLHALRLGRLRRRGYACYGGCACVLRNGGTPTRNLEHRGGDDGWRDSGLRRGRDRRRVLRLV